MDPRDALPQAHRAVNEWTLDQYDKLEKARVVGRTSTVASIVNLHRVPTKETPNSWNCLCQTLNDFENSFIAKFCRTCNKVLQTTLWKYLVQEIDMLKK